MKNHLKEHRFVILLFALILFNISLSIQYYFLKREETSKTREVVHFQEENLEKKITEELEHYQLRVYYPITSYPILNQEIDTKIKNHIASFKKEVSCIQNSFNQPCSLDILYREFQTDSYISYVFTIFQDTKGAHPISFYDTVSYNTKTNQIVTIENLLEENPKFLEIVSKNVREQLSKNSKIVSYDMMMEGTLPKVENFKTFAITEEGYLFFFSPYQVAPYSSGKFQVLVPYSILKEVVSS